MATVSTTTIQPTTSSDARFRSAPQFIHDALVTTAGWTDTAATGEVNLATMTAPAANNTFAGFKVYAMADSLQATYPCYLKIEFGRGFAANTLALRMAVGTAHDGAGTLTGTQLMADANIWGAQSPSDLDHSGFASGDTSRIAIALFPNSGSNRSLSFGVQRSKAADGSDTGDAIVFHYVGWQQFGVIRRSYVIPASGGVPPGDVRWMMPIPRPASGTGAFANKIAMGLLIPFAGEALRPATTFGNILLADAGSVGTDLAATIYGTTHNFKCLGSDGAGDNVMDVTNNDSRLHIRWD